MTDRAVWGGHASRRLVQAVLWTAVIALTWLWSDWVRIRAMLYAFVEVPSERVMAQPPSALEAIGFTEDNTADLSAYRAVAEQIVAGAQTDGERLRRLGDYFYSLRRESSGDLTGEARQGVSVIFRKMRLGEAASCGQMAVVLAALWRSLGGHTRQIRFASLNGRVSHYGIEVYSAPAHRWIYYDLNMNGYLADADGVPSPVASVRADLISDEATTVVASAAAHEWTVEEFRQALIDNPVTWYVLNNDWQYMEPGRRFGPLRGLFPVLSHLPYPIDRILDNVVGVRDRRAVLAGQVRVAGILSPFGARLVSTSLVCIIFLCVITLRRAT